MIEVRDGIRVVAAVGALATLLLAVGADTPGGILALVQLGLLIGGLPALLLVDTLRSRAAAAVVAVALSLSITAIAAQSLVWLRLARGELIVATATVYAIVLVQLLESVQSSSASASAEPRSDIEPW